MDEEEQEIVDTVQALITELELSGLREVAPTSQHYTLLALAKVLERVKALEAE